MKPASTFGPFSWKAQYYNSAYTPRRPTTSPSKPNANAPTKAHCQQPNPRRRAQMTCRHTTTTSPKFQPSTSGASTNKQTSPSQKRTPTSTRQKPKSSPEVIRCGKFLPNHPIVSPNLSQLPRSQYLNSQLARTHSPSPEMHP